MWSSSLQRNVVVQGVAAAPGALVWRGDGHVVSLTTPAAGGLSGSADIVDKLIRVADGYIFFDFGNNSEEVYDVNGELSSIHWAAGEIITFNSTATTVGTLAGPNTLNSIQNENGRSVAFGYDGVGRLSTITDAASQQVVLGYNASGMLSTITWPDTGVKNYVYENAAYPWALTGVIDEAGKRFATFGYDTNGFAISTEHAGGTNKYSAGWSSPPAISITDVFDSQNNVTHRYHDWVAPQGLFYSDPMGSVNQIATLTILGKTYVATQGQPAGSGCLASTSSRQYDSNGNVTTEDDFNGNRTCHAYDLTRNLATVTLEGLPTTKACPATLSSYSPTPVDAAHPERKITTVWHPDWVLKAREAEPRKIVAWVYNGQVDPISGTTANCVTPAATLPDGKPLAVLCTRYEQATTDATGALGMSATISGATRSWTYTYNQYGQVLTETTPKQSPTDSLSHTTTYAYFPTTSFAGSVGHTMGDLNTITNPLLQVTTFLTYDRTGRLVSSMDANSTVTSMTYWPRGWLHTQTVTPASGSPLTTTYDYWPTGMIKTVTMPDASTLNYAYDDAHRLTDITDAAANKIHFVLDNVGNRTGEQVTDASGQLVSTVTRVFDQLNRVQSTTGAMH